MLTKLSIRNFKAIQSADLPLRPLTLFTGLNAVGKSSALQCLLLLRQSLREGGFQKGLFLKQEDALSLGIGKDVFSIGAEPEATLDIGVQLNYEHDWWWAFEQALELDVLPLKEARWDSGFADQLSLFSSRFQYLSANRINPQSQYKASPYYVDELESLGKEGEYTVHYLAMNQDQPIRNPQLQHPHAKSDTLLDNVNAWMSEITPGVRTQPKYFEALEVASLSYRFEIESGYTGDFKPVNVGFGLTYALPVVTALLMLPMDGLLMVENPESHLHPGGQSRIARMCALAAASGIQVLLESHSDHVLNSLRVSVKQAVLPPDEVAVYYFHREANSPQHETEISPIFIDQNGRADEWPKGFFDEWDNQLDLLLED